MEFIQVVELPLGDALGMVSDGTITGAVTVLGLLLAGGGTVAGGALH